MKIGSSTISMASEHTLKRERRQESISLTGLKGREALIDTSSKTKSLFMQLKEESEAREKKNAENAAGSTMGSTASRGDIYSSNGYKNIKSIYELKMTLLDQMLEAMRRRQNHLKPAFLGQDALNGIVWQAQGTESDTGNNMYVSQRVQSYFYKEEENTAYVSEGKVITRDGREIGFNISFELSRSFEETYEEYFEESYRLCDPLVFNFEGNCAELTDQRFLFDLDCDGIEEEIAGLGKGSGFLALDQNNNGVIDNGSELFGTQSGDGFRDLAKYDDDGNGWIDEEDEIFTRLKIWTKDENGNDRIVDLKQAGVGAVYLGHADTSYNMTNDYNELMGMIRSTGIFLYENGDAGTLQHIDFSI